MKIDHLTRPASWTVVTLALAQLLLFLLSWLIVAAMPDTSMRSLLSTEGIRWFFGSFVNNISTPPLAWLVLVAMAIGAVEGSMIVKVWLKGRKSWTYRQTFAFRIVLVLAFIFLIFVALVAFIPHAPLLSATGSLAHSPFAHSLIPILAGVVIIASTIFGLLTGFMRSVEDVVSALAKGIGRCSWLILCYIFASELFFSIAYVFRLE
jgi:aminobenzoyl-glutamate transport protein